jgi:hypothetical protein
MRTLGAIISALIPIVRTLIQTIGTLIPISSATLAASGARGSM